jgi:hypothetical protein
LTNDPHEYTANGIFSNEFSDHLSVSCIRDAKLNLTLALLQRQMTGISMSNISCLRIGGCQISDSDQALNCLTSLLNSIADKHAPFKTLKDRGTSWFTHETARETSEEAFSLG